MPCEGKPASENVPRASLQGLLLGSAPHLLPRAQSEAHQDAEPPASLLPGFRISSWLFARGLSGQSSEDLALRGRALVTPGAWNQVWVELEEGPYTLQGDWAVCSGQQGQTGRKGPGDDSFGGQEIIRAIY